jgi:IS605 OrfB family transposase
VHATTEAMPIPIVTDRSNGGLGIDLNPMRVVLGRILADGNPISWLPIDYDFRDMSREQRKALMGEMVKQAVLLAQRFRVPLIIERLDFAAKKREWKSAGYNRMLSSFSYKLFYKMLRSTAADLGVQVIEVDPQDTSTIGIVKFGEGYGLSRDEAAALAIARRGLGFSERVSGRLITALPLPVDKGEHVLALWKRWRKLRRDLKLTGNGWQLKVRKVKAVKTKVCRWSKLDRSAGLPSLKSPKVIWPSGWVSGDKAPSFRG